MEVKIFYLHYFQTNQTSYSENRFVNEEGWLIPVILEVTNI